MVAGCTSGTAAPPPERPSLKGAAWSPKDLLLAVRSSVPESGLPVRVASQWVEGGTHVDLIDPTGAVRHLSPPEPLQLTHGPVWSPDGRMLAVAAGVGIWLVEVETNQWIRLGEAKAEETLTA